MFELAVRVRKQAVITTMMMMMIMMILSNLIYIYYTIAGIHNHC